MIKQQTASLQPGTHNQQAAGSQSGFPTEWRIWQEGWLSAALSGGAGF